MKASEPIMLTHSNLDADTVPRPSRRRWRTAGATLATTCALLALAGCGGADASSDGGSAGDDVLAGSGGAQTEDMAAYQECLAEHGVELPARGEMGTPPDGQVPTEGELPEGGPAAGGMPGGLPEGVDAEAFAEAQEACANLAPEGGPGTPGGPGGAGGEQFQEYLDCLEEQGVELEQPSDAPATDAPSNDDGAGSGQPPGGGIGQLDESDPAVAACADLRPELPAGGPGQAGQDQGSQDQGSQDQGGAGQSGGSSGTDAS